MNGYFVRCIRTGWPIKNQIDNCKIYETTDNGYCSILKYIYIPTRSNGLQPLENDFFSVFSMNIEQRTIKSK